MEFFVPARGLKQAATSKVGQGLSSVIHILKTDNVILLQIFTSLNFYENQDFLTLVRKAVALTGGNENTFIGFTDPDCITQCHFRPADNNDPVL